MCAVLSSASLRSCPQPVTGAAPTWSVGTAWLPSDPGQTTGAGHGQQRSCSHRRLWMLGTRPSHWRVTPPTTVELLATSLS